jgi:sulfide:quinone oxidoreductase
MRVLVAGGGIAALEALAGLRALAGDRVEATLLAPDAAFSYRPLSTAVPFTFREQRTRPLAELAEGLGARFVHDALAEVDEERSRVLTRDGDFIPYDALLVAVGARVPRGAPPGVMFERGREGRRAFAGLIRELEDGTAKSVAVVVPRAAAWPIDAYELSFVASLAARRGGGGAKVFLLTAEGRPLEALGEAASETIGDELSRSNIELITDAEVRDRTTHDERGSDAFSSAIVRLTRRDRPRGKRRLVLHLEPDSTLVVDRAISLPVAQGPAVAGTAHDRRGFTPVDEHARIPGSPGHFAAGDATALSLKHSTIAASQGSAAAASIAAQAGANIEPSPWSPVLYGILTVPPHLTGARGSPWLGGGEPVTHCLWWPPGHVSGRYLAPYLASRDPGVRAGLEWHPNGLPMAVRLNGDHASESEPRANPPSEDVLRHDALSRQLMAIRRTEREGEELGLELRAKGAEFERHEREVVKRLEAAGYLSHVARPR